MAMQVGDRKGAISAMNVTPLAGPGFSRLLFVGPLTYEPNRLAVEWLVREIMPRIRRDGVYDAELVVVGENRGIRIPRSDEPWIRFTGWVPDVTPFYTRATVAVTPLHSGGGTRLKVIEALARCVPLVSTSFGCHGFGLIEGVDLLVADEAPAFAAACVTLLTDEGVRERLITAGRTRYDGALTAEFTSRSVAELANDTLAKYAEAPSESPEPS